MRSRVTGYIEAVHFRAGLRRAQGRPAGDDRSAPNEAKVKKARGRSCRAEHAHRPRPHRTGARREAAGEPGHFATRVRREGRDGEGLRGVAAGRRRRRSMRRSWTCRSRASSRRSTAGSERPRSRPATTCRPKGRSRRCSPRSFSANPIYVSFEIDERVFVKFGLKSRAGGRNGRLPIEVGLLGEEGFPHKALLEYVDNRVDPADRQRAHARGARQSRRLAHAGPVRARAPVRSGRRERGRGGAGPCDRHRPGSPLRLRGG